MARMFALSLYKIYVVKSKKAYVSFLSNAKKFPFSFKKYLRLCFKDLIIITTTIIIIMIIIIIISA